MSGTNGNRPQIKRLPLDSLFIDNRYQRPLNERVVGKITGAFEPIMCGVLEVSTRAGDKFAVLDGQHRLAGLQLLDETDWDCRVHENLTAKEEARLFVRLQSERMFVTPIHRHKALVFEKDKLALSVDNLVNDAGYRITTNKTHGSLTCVIGLYQAYERYGSQALRDALKTIENVWGVNDNFARKAPIVVGMTMLLSRAGKDIDMESFESRLGNVKSAQVTRDSQMQGASHTTHAERIAMQLAQIYNKGRTVSRIPSRYS